MKTAVKYLVIARNSDIDVTQRRIRVTEGNNRYVYVGRFGDRLFVFRGVSHN
jgi:hypothetical protein